MSQCGVLAWSLILLPRAGVAGEAEPEQVPRQCLVIPSVGRYGRSAVHRDAIEALIVAGKWATPKAGDTVTLPDGSTRAWEPLGAREDGWFEHEALGGGYAAFSVEAEAARVMLLEASGHNMVYVNGEPRMGDPYQTGYVRLPILLRQGPNELLFLCGRGRLRVALATPKAAAMLSTGDLTLPDLIVGEATDTWGAVIVTNASQQPLDGAAIEATLAGNRPARTPLPAIPPLTVRKVGFRLRGSAPREGDRGRVRLRLLAGGKPDEPADTAVISLRIRQPEQSQKRTFISEIDGSVQYYAVNPAQPLSPGRPPPALFLTLHGAGVEAIGQADAYSPKTWGHLVAPTNRRPYGFDWEDWGRLDALEVLEAAQARLHTDPARTYLTGHSMGGHGVWQVGVTVPDRFGAIGPSAGWVSFMSYAGGRADEKLTPMQEMLLRAAGPSDTLSLVRNTTHYGVYILHGEKDDNVPVTEARTMRDALAAFHHDFVYHEQAGAGHWWDASDEPGTDCVDWAPMFDLFGRHVIPADESVRQVDFVTASPGVSAQSHWVSIEAQTHCLQRSSVSIRWDPWARRFVGTTSNVSRLGLSLEHAKPGAPIGVELDGQKIEAIPWPAETRHVWLARAGERWSVISKPSASLKGPQRYGPFKDAFRSRMVFVYGTRGTPEENAWAFAKARYDAEQWWYRGNGSIDVLPDTAFDPSNEADRSVILYGNADTSAAWAALLADSPVQARRGSVRVGDRELTGADLACLFLQPRPGSDRALVGVVTGSGPAGMRLTDRLPYFLSGVAYPDCTVLGPECLSQGVAGVRAAGFFGEDWSVEKGEFAWADGPR